MKEYDVIVVGSGSGMSIVETALNHEKKVAVVDKGPIGGTCLNVGCIPSKMLIYPADVISETKDSGKFGIKSTYKDIDFEGLMKHVNNSVNQSQKHQIEGIKETQNLDLYNEKGEFVDNYTIKVDEEKIQGEKIFLASGARPLIPPIEGIKEVDYLTNESLLGLREQPDSLAVIGGGYVSAEYSHFFSSIGTDVKIIQRNRYLVPNEESSISQKPDEVYKQKMEVHTNIEAVEVTQRNDKIKVKGKETNSGKEKTIEADELLVAAGRQSNADLLKIENTDIETDNRNYIKTNKKMETSVNNIWAIGDAVGKEMFKHVANREASIAAHNAFHDAEAKIDYEVSPHAVFSYPPIASVGYKENTAKDEFDDILVGKANYNDVAKGEAMLEKNGFAKGIVEPETGKILGFHIIGPYSPIVIQEVINAMANDQPIDNLFNGMHIHPALPEIVMRTFGRLKRK